MFRPLISCQIGFNVFWGLYSWAFVKRVKSSVNVSVLSVCIDWLRIFFSLTSWRENFMLWLVYIFHRMHSQSAGFNVLPHEFTWQWRACFATPKKGEFNMLRMGCTRESKKILSAFSEHHVLLLVTTAYVSVSGKHLPESSTCPTHRTSAFASKCCLNVSARPRIQIVANSIVLWVLQYTRRQTSKNPWNEALLRITNAISIKTRRSVLGCYLWCIFDDDIQRKVLRHWRRWQQHKTK
jgi:hypothetical protein